MQKMQFSDDEMAGIRELQELKVMRRMDPSEISPRVQQIFDDILAEKVRRLQSWGLLSENPTLIEKHRALEKYDDELSE